MKRIYYNGDIYTGDEAVPWAEYVITEGNKIEEVGTTFRKELLEQGMEAVDLKGRMLLSGFIDAHAHPFTSAFLLSQIVFDFELTAQEVLETLKAYILEHPEKDSYYGMGYNENALSQLGFKKEMLDEICKEKPILLVGCGGHDGWVNTAALKAAGIDRNHPDPIPGFQIYERDADGEPTGHLLESGPIAEIVEAIKPFTASEAENKLMEIVDTFSSYGITSIADCGILSYLEEEGRKLLDMCIEKNMLKQRIFGSNQITEKEHLNNWKPHLDKLRKKYDTDRVRIHTFKVVNDGTLEADSASMMEPFETGSPMFDPLLSGEEYQRVCVEAAKAGYHLHLHGIGDRANHENLMAARAVREAGCFDVRITNAHTQCVLADDIPLFAKYNVIANTTGVWICADEEAEKLIGDRAKRMFLLKSILKHGGRLTLGSDFPGDELGVEPLKSIEMVVTRRMLGELDAPVLEPEDERLTLPEAIRAFTETVAYQVGMETKLGTIEAGKYADFVVLGANLFEAARHEIHKIPVMMTVMDGETVYNREEEALA